MNEIKIYIKLYNLILKKITSYIWNFYVLKFIVFLIITNDEINVCNLNRMLNYTAKIYENFFIKINKNWKLLKIILIVEISSMTDKVSERSQTLTKN